MAINNNEALYQILVGIDEAGSSAKINSELRALAKTLSIDIAPKITANNRSAIIKQLSDAVKQATSKIDFDFSKLEKYVPPEFTIRFNSDAIKASIDKLVGGLGKEFFKAGELNAIVEELQKATNAGFELSKAFRNADGDLKIMGTTTDEYGNKMGRVLKLTKDGFESVSTSFVSGQTKEIESKIAEIGRIENELNKLITLTASGSNKVTNETSGQIASLRTEIENNYKGLEAFVSNAANLTKAHKAELLGYIQDLRTARAQNEAQAEAKGKEANSYAVATQALKEYRKEADNLVKTNLGQNTGLDPTDIRNALTALREVAKEYPNITAEMQKIDILNEKTFDVALLKQQKAEVDGLEKELTALYNTIRNTSKSFKDASFKGDMFNSKASSEALTRLMGDFDQLTIKIGTLSQKGLIPETELTKLQKIGQEITELGDQSRIAAINAQELDDRLGKVIENSVGIGKLDSSIGDNTDAMKEYVKEITGLDALQVNRSKTNTNLKRITDVLTVSYKDQNGEVRKLTLSQDALANGWRSTGNAADDSRKKVQSFGDKIQDATKKIAMWGLSTKIVYGVWNSFKEGVQVIEELDKELTQIAVVSGTTREAVQGLGKDFAATAVAMSQTVTDVAKLNTELVRQGLTLQESAERADTIMKLSSAGAISMEQSLAVITSGTNALGESHEKIADVLLKAANVTASDVEGLGEAFTKTASGAKAAGLSIEQTTAMLATMKDVTQEGDSQLGTSLKSILARFNKINEETGLYNENLNTVQTAIESVGVAFTDSEGQIRSTYDILADLSVRWDDLDRNTQAYIATQAAGTRQQNRFFAIMQNFNSIQGVHNDLLDSAGTLQGAYAVYLSSSEAASKRLKASTEQLWVNFINSDTLVFLKNVATGIVQLVDNLGIAGIAVAGLTTKLMMLSTAFKKDSFAGLATVFGKVVKAVAGLASGAGIASGALFTLKGAMMSLLGATGVGAIALAVGAAVGFIVKKFGEGKAAAEELAKKQADLYNEALTLSSSQNQRASSIKDLGEEYLALSRKVEQAGGTFVLTKEEADRYYKTQAELSELLPNLETHLDSQGNVILDNVDSMSQLVAINEEYLRQVAEAAAPGAVADWEERKAEYDEEIERIEKLIKKKERERDIAVAKYGAGSGIKAPPMDTTEYDNEINALLAQLEDHLNKGIPGVWQNMVTQLTAEGIKIPENLNRVLQSEPIRLAVSSKSSEEALAFFKEQIAALQDETKNIDFGDTKKSLAEVMTIFDTLKEDFRMTGDAEAYHLGLNEIIVALESMPEDSPFAALFDGVIAQAEATQSSIVNTAETAEALKARQEENQAKQTKQIQESTAAYEDQTKKIAEYANVLDLIKTKGIDSPEVTAAIQQGHLNLIQFLGDETEMTKALKAEQAAATEAQLQAYADLMFSDQAYRDNKTSGWAEATEKIKTLYGIDLNNFTTAEAAKGNIASQLIGKLTQEQQEYFSFVDGKFVLQGDAYQALVDRMNSNNLLDAEQAAAEIAILDEILLDLEQKYLTGKITLDEYNQALVEQGTITTGAADETARLAAETAAAEQAQSAANSAMQSAKAELEELAWFQWQVNEGKMSQAEIDDYLLANHPLWIAQGNDKIALNGLIENSMIDLQNTQIQSYIDMMTASGMMTTEQANNYKALVDYLARAYKIDATNSAGVAEAKVRINNEMIRVLGKNWDEYYRVQNGLLVLQASKLQELSTAASREIQVIDEATGKSYTRSGRILDGLVAKMKVVNNSKMNLDLFNAHEFLNSGMMDTIENFVNKMNKSSADVLKKLIKEKKDAEAKAAEAARKKEEAEAKRKAKAAEAARKKAEAEQKRKDAAAKKAAREKEAAAKKAAKEAEKAAKEEQKAREKAAKAEEKVAKAAEEALGATKEELALRQEIADLNAKQEAASIAEEVFNVAKEFLEWQKELLTEEITDALNKEKEGLLDALSLEEERLKKAEEYNNYLKERKALQDSIANLEYRSAIASLDSSVGGRANQRRLAEELAAEREKLTKTEEDRMKAVQDEEFAKRRAKIETLYAEWLRLVQAASDEELTNAELLKLKKLAAEGDVHAQKILQIQEEYNQEQIYLDSLNAIQTGMIRTFTGELIPLEEAYKRLNIQNGKFWTFFGQKDVDDFKDKVKQAMAAVEKYGLKALQQWKDLSTEIQRAEDKLQEYLDSIKNADTTVPPPKTSSGSSSSKPSSSGTSSSKSSSGGSSSSKSSSGGSSSSKSSSSKPSSSKPSSSKPSSTKSTTPTVSAQTKRLQSVVNKAADHSSTDNITRVAVDGIFGDKTAQEVRDMVSKFFDYGKRYGSMNLATSLRTAASKRSISKSIVDRIAGLTFPKASGGAAGGGSGAKQTYSAYSEGGKVDYTGPAMVHGSPSKPEYVFNYPQFKDLAKMIARNQFTASRPAITNAIPPKIDIQIGNLINVEGNITKDVVPKVERITEHAMTELKRTIKGWGK